ncbi:hypothetical protein ACSBR1_002221 [Camellia fascicularis]
MCGLKFASGDTYYLKPRSTTFKLIADLPDSNKGASDDYLIVSAIPQSPKSFRQSYILSRDLVRILSLPIGVRKAPVLLNYRRGSDTLSYDPENPSLVFLAFKLDTGVTVTAIAKEMGRKPTIAEDLLDGLSDIPKSKLKRVKKAKAKATITEILSDSEKDPDDSLLISKLVDVEKRSAEAESSDVPLAKKSRSEGQGSGSGFHLEETWAPEVLASNRRLKASNSAIENLKVSAALSTTVLLSVDMNQLADFNYYENFAMMMRHSVLAIQHAHSHAVKTEFVKKDFIKKTQEAAGLLTSLNKAETRVWSLMDKVKAAQNAQSQAEAKVEAAEAVAKVTKAEANAIEIKVAEAEAKLKEALHTK